MLKKINKIKNAGIFRDYSWDSSLPEFKRYNLIYGWNGSGKTTLSNLFAASETGISDKHPTIEYEIETDTGNIKQGETSSRKARVFNQDYIAKNIEVLSGKAKPIFILGEENKKIAEEIKKDEQLLMGKEEKLKTANDSKTSQIKQKDKQFTDIARTISANTSGEATRKYNKTNAEAAFKQLSAKELLEETDIIKNNLTLRQLEKQSLKELSIPESTYHNKELDLCDLLKKIIIESTDLSAQTVESIIIDRLKQNDDISKWVEDGVALHGKYKSKTCEYCNQPLPEQRIKSLADHFNEADKKLKNNVDVLVEELRKVYSLIDGIKPIDKANLYEEIQAEYQSAAQTLEDAKKDILEKVIALGKSLKDKKSKTTESIKLCYEINISQFTAAIEKVNTEIRKHNAKTNNFRNEKDTAQKKLEKHYLSTIYDDIKNLETNIKNVETEMKKLADGDPDNPSEIGINNLKKRIAGNKVKISSLHKGCKQINENLKTFLGRDEIVFEAEEEGYVIKRHGVIAENLSEGEKNAIAFVYFTVHLQDQNFDIKEGIVVVDDPVSSLDSNSLFQAFAFLKNTVKDAHQIILFTHSFDFLRLLLGWLNYRKLKDVRSLYMLKNHYGSEGRNAEITKLDQLLQDHESEYHYLFKRLYNFQSEGTIESVYDVPNLARKVLDTFLMFRVPNNKSIYEKLSDLTFDEHKKAAIYKFTNDQSHITGGGFDPSLVQETQNNVKYLLEMMERVFPEHYKILVESISN